MKLVASKAFEKKYKKIASKNPKLKQSIDKTLQLMEKDLYHPHLETHFKNLQLDNILIRTKMDSSISHNLFVHNTHLLLAREIVGMGWVN